jgi:formate dehydrogenase
MCADRCGIEVQLEEGRVAAISGDPEHLFNRGRTCLKARAAVEMVHHPDRLTTPLRRVGDGWEEVSLGEALDEIVTRLEGITA